MLSLHVCSDVYVFMLSSQDGFTPLLGASQNGHSQVVELLLSKGADVNLPKQVQRQTVLDTQIIRRINTAFKVTDVAG